jgi:branched-chain amino acid transport system ATP-binding protein
MLEVKDVTVKFGGLYANKDITLEVKTGSITGLIGPNGAGKTTFFNAISGVYKPTSGNVIFEGRDITGLQPYKINHLGMTRTYQIINLFKKMSVLENVMVGMHGQMKQGFFSSMLKTGKERKEEALVREKAYELLDFVNLKDYAKEPSGTLSYGDQRRLEIVRGLASNPKLILLDEPCAGMNSREKDSLNELLYRIRERNVTILIIEHDMKLVMGVTDYIYVLNYGKLLAQGTPKEVQQNPDVITAYLGEE